MDKMQISFSHEGKEYEGSFDEVHGAGAKVWYLMIDDYYVGRLRFMEAGWFFDPTPKNESMAKLAVFFGEHVTAENFK